MKIINKLLKFKQRYLCFHKYISFKVGEFPLIAAYCPKCGTVKFGNCIYYDGTIYQKKIKGEKAIQFVRKYAEELKRRNEMMKDYELQTGLSLFDHKEIQYRNNRETVEDYERIVSVL